MNSNIKKRILMVLFIMAIFFMAFYNTDVFSGEPMIGDMPIDVHLEGPALSQEQSFDIIFSVIIIVLSLVVGFVLYARAREEALDRLSKRNQLCNYGQRWTPRMLDPSPIKLVEIDFPPTEEELEKIELERIRKDARLKMLEEMTRNLTAILDPKHVLESTMFSISGFEPDGEQEELAYEILSTLYEEAKEKMKDGTTKSEQ